MNIFLWILQIALAFLYVSGGAYKTFKFEELARYMPALSHTAWRLLGVIEIVGGILLVIPAAVTHQPTLIALAAAVLTLESLSLAALYARYSLKMTAKNPLVWAATLGVFAAFLTYGRFSLLPPA